MDDSSLISADERDVSNSQSTSREQQQNKHQQQQQQQQQQQRKLSSLRRQFAARQKKLLESQRRQKKLQEENNSRTFCDKYIVSSFTSFYRFLRSANYIVFLLSFTSLCCLVFAIILLIISPNVRDSAQYSSSTNSSSIDSTKSLSFLDALFISVSAFTASGLTTEFYYDWGAGTYFLLGLEMTMGSIVLLTMLPALLRYRPLARERTKLIELLEATGAYGHYLDHAVDREFATSPTRNNNNNNEEESRQQQRPDEMTKKSSVSERERTSSILGYGQKSEQMMMSSDAPLSLSNQEHANSTDSPTAASPSTTLTPGQRIVIEDGLAHINQQIDICLIIIFGCIFYWFATHFIFTVLLLIGGRDFGWALFTTISAFNNAGFSIDRDSLIEIDTDIFLMIVITIVMALGNSLFPLMFRLMLSGTHMILEKLTGGIEDINGETASSSARHFLFGQPLRVWKHSLWLFLRYPRRYYTHLFSMKTSLVLFVIWFVVTFVGLALLAPELNHDGVLAARAQSSHAFFIGLFQSVTVRTCGFTILDVTRVSAGHLTWWVFAFVFAAYPFILTQRSSETSENVRLMNKKTGRRNEHHQQKQRVSSGDSDEMNDEISAGDGNLTLSLTNEDDEDEDEKDDNDSVLEDYYEDLLLQSTSSNFDETLRSEVKELNKETKHETNDNDNENDKEHQFNSSVASSSSDDDRNDELYLRYTSARSHHKNPSLSPTNNNKNRGNQKSVKSVATDQLARDLFWLYLAITIIMYCEHRSVPKDEIREFGDERNYALYLKVVFEVASAFGNVGLSISNVPGVSFSGSFQSAVSKIVMILVMYFGKHRFLPKSVDEAIAIKIRTWDFSDESKEDLLNPAKKSKSFGNLQEAVRGDSTAAASADGGGGGASAAAVTPAANARRLYYKTRVENLYSLYNPARLPHVDRILSAFEENPKALLRNLCATYGPEPGKR